MVIGDEHWKMRRKFETSGEDQVQGNLDAGNYRSEKRSHAERWLARRKDLRSFAESLSLRQDRAVANEKIRGLIGEAFHLVVSAQRPAEDIDVLSDEREIWLDEARDVLRAIFVESDVARRFTSIVREALQRIETWGQHKKPDVSKRSEALVEAVSEIAEQLHDTMFLITLVECGPDDTNSKVSEASVSIEPERTHHDGPY